MIRRPKFICLCFIHLIITGCSSGTIKMYEGERLTKDKVAYIETTGELKTVLPKEAAVIIRRIDNKETNMQKAAIHPQVEVLPGMHTLEIQLFRKLDASITGNSSGSAFKEYSINKTLTLNLEAGHRYRIFGTLDPALTFPWSTWIEDYNIGKIVAGHKP